MSAVDIFLTPQRALIFTDASQYDRDGVLVALVDKACVVEATKLVVTGSGNAWFPEMVAAVLENATFTIDEVVLDGGNLIEECFRIAEPKMMMAGKSMNRLYIVGWSHAAGRPIIASWDNTLKDGEPRFSTADLIASPAPDQNAAMAIGREMGDFTSATVDYKRLGVATMKAQRFMEGKAEFNAVGKFLVGGHIQRTDVTAAGITKQIVHAWPEDRIGEKIRPKPEIDPVAHPNVASMVGVSRAERRRLEKLQRKGAA